MKSMNFMLQLKVLLGWLSICVSLKRKMRQKYSRNKKKLFKHGGQTILPKVNESELSFNFLKGKTGRKWQDTANDAGCSCRFITKKFS